MAAHFSIRKALQAVLGLSLASNAAAQSAGDGSNPTYDVDSTFKTQMLNSTNTYRVMYGASPIVWNNSLAAYAQNAANGCVFEHTGGPYGENIAEGYASTTDTCQAWGDERLEYSWSDPGFSEATGHFTQLVWKDTQQVGCGRTFCGSDHGWYVVCEYLPAGNVIGSFASEVGTLVKGATLPTTSATPTQTLIKQTVAAQTSQLPQFTGAAARVHIGGMQGAAAAAGVLGALAAWA